MVLRAQKEPQDPGPVLLAEQATHACPCPYAHTRQKSSLLFLPPFDERKAPGPLANTGKLTASSSPPPPPPRGHTLLGVGEGKYRMREPGRGGRKPGAPVNPGFASAMVTSALHRAALWEVWDRDSLHSLSKVKDQEKADRQGFPGVTGGCSAAGTHTHVHEGTEAPCRALDLLAVSLPPQG